MIQLLIIILTVNFCSCRINKECTADNDFENLNLVIKNKSQNTYYFNTIDINHPSCGIIYKDDERMIKEFHFSLDAEIDEVKYDMTMQPSSFSYAMKPSDEIEFTVTLKDGINDYYQLGFDEGKGIVEKKFLGFSKENYFFIFCSRKPFSYNSHYSDYCKKIKEFGIELEGKQSNDNKIEFVID